MIDRALAMTALLLLVAAACGDDSETPPAPETSVIGPTPPSPPAGTNCAELSACCASLDSDAQLFCRLSVQQNPRTPGDCGPGLEAVRRYLGERGTPVPSPCQVGSGGGSGAAPTWVDVALPDVEGWHREPGEDNGPDQGFITEYYAAANQMTASVFVYRGGVPNISRDAAVLRGEVERTFTGMQRAVEAGAYQDVRAAGDVELTTFGENGPPAAHQRVVIETTEGTRLSETLVTTHRGFFFKVRVTINVEPTPELTHQLNALYVALGRAVVES